MSPEAATFAPFSGLHGEKRPRFEALLGRAFTFFVLYILASVVFLEPGSLVRSVGASMTKAVLGIAAGYNFAWWILLRRLAYSFDNSSMAIRLALRMVRVSYQNIARVKRQDTPWPIKKSIILTYAKEVPQLIEYVAQIGAFIVEGRGKIYLYSTLSSYHDPKGLILITTTDGKTYGISPAEPERFLEELEKRRRQARPQ